jgi:DNA ligase-1
VLLARVVETSAAVAATSARGKKLALIAECLRALAPDERAIGARYLAGVVGYTTGIGYALAHGVAARATPAAEPSLALVEVERRFAAIAALRGPGSATARERELGALLSLATADEQRFLSALAVGELRQGAEDAMVVDAIARAAELPPGDVRRAYMLAGELGAIAEAALGDGAAAIARFDLSLFRPILPMLAQTAESTDEALARHGGELALEHKLDGFRVQIHKDGDDVRVYSRGLNDVADCAPEIVAIARALPARALILDGEAISLGDGGRPRPFQDTMRRFGKRAASDELRAALPLSLSLFDVLRVDARSLLAAPARDRFALLDELAPAHAVPRVITGDAAAAAAFYERAIALGHEGVMAKALAAPYDAGNRGAAWLKIKQVHRLDLVVLAAEWGSGRRKGWLSNLHLGARGGTDDGWTMLGKTFKGMTDEILAWQTRELLAREVDRDGHVVYVRPELVAEIAFNDVQRSPRYPGGLALRLARLVRYREDKTPADADTIDAVRAIAIAAGVIK